MKSFTIEIYLLVVKAVLHTGLLLNETYNKDQRKVCQVSLLLTTLEVQLGNYI